MKIFSQNPTLKSGGGELSRNMRKVPENSSDPYYEGAKYPDPTVCTSCGAVFHNGHWQWMDEEQLKVLKREKQIHQDICPACRRLRDRYPAGYLFLSGGFLKDHREEILNTIRNEAEKETMSRPLVRVMWIEEKDGEVEIATTTDHLAKHLGNVVKKAFKGDLTVKFSDGEKLARVYWRRD